MPATETKSKKTAPKPAAVKKPATPPPPAPEPDPLPVKRVDGWLNLTDICGVTEGPGGILSYSPHTDFHNPKETPRLQVLSSLNAAERPDDVDAIECYAYGDGWVALDGDHRIMHAIQRANSDEPKWKRIRYYVSACRTKKDAQIRQQIQNIEGRRGNLTEAEELAVVKRLFEFGLSKDQVKRIVGAAHSDRWLNRVERVLTSPTATEAVIAGDVDMGTADKITVQHDTEEEREEAIETNKNLRAEGATPNEARQRQGLRAPRPKFAKWPVVLKQAAVLYESLPKDIEDSIAIFEAVGRSDQFLDGQLDSFFMLMGQDGKSASDRITFLRDLHETFLKGEAKGG